MRTRSWHYSVFNLHALFLLAVLGERVGIDLWNYPDKKNSALRKALDYLLPYCIEPDKWKYKQIEKISSEEIYPLVLIARKKYDKNAYDKWLKKLSNDENQQKIENLIYE